MPKAQLAEADRDAALADAGRSAIDLVDAEIAGLEAAYREDPKAFCYSGRRPQREGQDGAGALRARELRTRLSGALQRVQALIVV